MTLLHPHLEPVYENVLRPDPGEADFHQAVFEVLGSLGPMVAKRPDYVDAQRGGSQVRTGATGYGTIHFLDEVLRARGKSFQRKEVVVSGSGDIAAIYVIEKAQQLCGTVIACNDSHGWAPARDHEARPRPLRRNRRGARAPRRLRRGGQHRGVQPRRPRPAGARRHLTGRLTGTLHTGRIQSVVATP